MSSIQSATSNFTPNSAAASELDGFDTPSHEWANEGAKMTIEETGIKERISTRDHLDTAKNSVYTDYQKMATQEDNELVTRWTETLNILLTFAGLLSGIITAFLLTLQTDLDPRPNELTNKILLHIASRLDNTTDISQYSEQRARSAPVVRILGYWHASLGCSLLSAFGSLLSKQWVLHYQSTPGWANTLEQQCHLREIRAHGLSKWRMHAIIDSLPVLLQLAVVLFYLGLAESVNSMPTLFYITVTFAVAIFILYIFTLITGTFYSSCPFRSPVTDVFYQIAMILKFLAHLSIEAPVKIFLTCLEPSSTWVSFTKLGDSIKTGWRRTLSLGRNSPSHTGERTLSQGPEGAAGVMFWWLQESGWDIGESGWNIKETTWIKMQVVAGIIRATPAETAYRMAIWRGGFGSWCHDVFMGLLGGAYPASFALLEADVVYHLMHHSAEGDQAVRNGLTEYRNESDPTQTLGRVCDSLRKGWADPLQIPTAPKPLPITNMEPSILSTYLRLQLIDWSYAAPASRSNHDLLLRELPEALPPNYFPRLPQYFDSIIDTTSLAAVALIPGDNNSQVKSVKELIGSRQLERLLQAVHRLSHYPRDHPPDQMVSLAVAAAAKVLKSKVNSVKHDESQELFECPSWKSGEFAQSLYRLLGLGRMWWHADSDTDSSKYGASLIHTTHFLLDISIPLGVEVYRGDFPQWICPSPADFAEILAAHAHPDAPHSPSHKHTTEATGLLDFVSSLRYVTLPSTEFAWLKTPLFTPKLEEYPQVIRQLIHDIETAHPYSRLRQASLSVVVKGRDMFLPAAVAAPFPGLVEDLERLADEWFQSKNFILEMPRELYMTFYRWDELVQALEGLQRVLGHPVRQRRDPNLETAIGEAPSPVPSAPEHPQIGPTSTSLDSTHSDIPWDELPMANENLG